MKWLGADIVSAALDRYTDSKPGIKHAQDKRVGYIFRSPLNIYEEPLVRVVSETRTIQSILNAMNKAYFLLYDWNV